MNRRAGVGVAALLLLAALVFYFRPLWFSGAAKVLVASSDGSGEACTLFAPCALTEAQVQARAAQVNGDVLVYLRGGEYTLRETWRFDEQDSGREGRWTIYRAYPGERPILSGGLAVDGWRPEPGGVYSAAWNGPAFRQLYVNGARMVRARTPNRENEADMGPYLRPLAWDLNGARIAVRGEDARNIPTQNAVEMVVASHWHLYRLRPSGFTPDGARVWVDFREPERSEPAFGQIAQLDSGLNPSQDESYYWENDLSFLDAPGEWFLDETAGRVYYLPLAGQKMETARVVVPRTETLLALQGSAGNPVRRVRFEGLTFEYSAWLAPSAQGYVTWQAALQPSSGRGERFPGMLEIAIAEQVEIIGCTLRHAGAHGLVTRGQTSRLKISGSLFEDLSAGGIMLDVLADPAGGSRDDTIADNIVRTAGRDYSDAVGIWASFPNGLVLEHNEIYNLPYSGISVGWKWDPEPSAAGKNQIRANHIHHVLQKHDDGGAIYTLGRQPGTVIAENWIHDLVRSPFAGQYPIKGIYLDEGSTEITVARNWIEMKMDDTINLHKTFEPIYYDDPLLLKADPKEIERIKQEAGPRGKSHPSAWE